MNMEEQQFYRCRECGKIINMFVSRGTPIYCCGYEMKELVPQYTEKDEKQYLPVAIVDGNHVIIDYSQSIMKDERDSDDFVYIQTAMGEQKKLCCYKQDDRIVFSLSDNDVLLCVYVYSSKHGLWKISVEY